MPRTTYTPTVSSTGDALIGRTLDGRYRVLSRIAEGGMATVYLAVDERLDREVALKVMREHLWMPVLNINMDQVANKKISGARPHMIYQNTFYKGLDVSRQK